LKNLEKISFNTQTAASNSLKLNLNLFLS